MPRGPLPSLPRRWLRALRIAALCGLVGLLWWSVDWRASLALLTSADARWLALSGLLLTVQTVLSAIRWRLTAARLGIAITPWRAIREYYLSQLVNQSLPGGVLGDANRAVRARSEAGLLASAQAVVFERIAGQLGLLTVLIKGLVLGLVMPTGMAWPAWVALPVASGLVGLVCFVIGLALWARRMRRVRGTDTVVHRFAHAVLAREVAMRQAGLSLGSALCNIAGFALCATALGVSLPVLAIAALVPLILFAMVLPITISGWGLREGAAAALFPLVGATSAEGLATSIAFGLVFLATVLPGALITWLRPNAPVLDSGRATIDP